MSIYDAWDKALKKAKPVKRKSYQSPRTKLSTMEVDALVDLNKRVETSGTSPTNSLYKYDEKTRKKLNDIGWAIRNTKY